MYGQMRNFFYFPHWFGALAFKAMAISEISLISHKNLPFVPNCQTKFINLIHHHIVYALAGFIGL